MITFQEILKAYQNCRRSKPYSRQQVLFDLKLSKKLTELTHSLNNNKYKLQPYNFFQIEYPKPREIFAAHFADRIVHHYLVSKQEPIWEKKFINSSFACRKGKGTVAAVQYFCKKVHDISQGGTQPVYILQLDMKLFFASIHRPTLVSLYHKHNPYNHLSSLIDLIIGHDARKNIRRFKPINSKSQIPFQKSWFSKAADFGLPIGNLTSQFGSNIYMNDFDHYVERILKPQAYLRYVDDMTFIDTDKSKLEQIASDAKNWLYENRKLEINNKKTKLSLLKDGIDLLGYHIKQVGNTTYKPNKNSTIILTPKSKKWDFIKTLKQLRQKDILQPKKLNPLCSKKVYLESNQKIASINSKIGHMQHAKTYQFRKHSIDKLIINTAIVDFNCDLEKRTYWQVIKTKKYKSIKNAARIKKFKRAT